MSPPTTYIGTTGSANQSSSSFPRTEGTNMARARVDALAERVRSLLPNPFNILRSRAFIRANLQAE